MTLTETLVIIDITKTKSNNCFIIQQETKSVQTSHDCPYKLCIVVTHDMITCDLKLP